jgi:hypothetical protein
MSALLAPYVIVGVLLLILVAWNGRLQSRLNTTKAGLSALISLMEPRAHRNPEARLIVSKAYAKSLLQWLSKVV